MAERWRAETMNGKKHVPSRVRSLADRFVGNGNRLSLRGHGAGPPLLDRSGTDSLILRRWLGRFVAEPQWAPRDSVNYFAER